MKLEELYQDFELLSPEERMAFVAEYRAKRASELRKNDEAKTKKQLSIGFTEQEKLMMKLLGLKAKDLKALKSLKDDDVSENNSEEEAAILFDDNNLMLETNE